MKRYSWPILIFLCVVCAVRGEADGLDGPDMRAFFAQGRSELMVGGGFGSSSNNDYLILLLGGSYYLRDGLSLGLTGEAWVGSQPQIYNVSPQIRYVFFDNSWRFKPYLGAFYRRTFYTQAFEPINSGGGRAGLVFPLTARAYWTAGAVYEHYFNCNKTFYTSCDAVYPEIGFAVGF